MMQICAFADGDPRRSKVSWVILSRLLSPSPEPPTLKNLRSLQDGWLSFLLSFSSYINKPVSFSLQPNLGPAQGNRRSKSISTWRLSLFSLRFDFTLVIPPAALPVLNKRLHTWWNNGGAVLHDEAKLSLGWQEGIALSPYVALPPEKNRGRLHSPQLSANQIN